MAWIGFTTAKQGRAEKGLEWSVVAIVDLQQKTGYTLSAQQTEAGPSYRQDKYTDPIGNKEAEWIST